MDARQVLIAAPPGNVRRDTGLVGTLPQVRVMVTAEGQATREAARACAFDLVVLDAGLPLSGGLALLSDLHAARPDARYLVLADRVGDIAPLLAVGADAVRVKGFPAGELLSLMMQLLEDCCE